MEGPGKPTAIQVAGAGSAAIRVGSDRREHVDYDLVITNGFTAKVTLKLLTVPAVGTRLLKLSGKALAWHTHQIIAGRSSAPKRLDAHERRWRWHSAAEKTAPPPIKECTRAHCWCGAAAT